MAWYIVKIKLELFIFQEEKFESDEQDLTSVQRLVFKPAVPSSDPQLEPESIWRKVLLKQLFVTNL